MINLIDSAIKYCPPKSEVRVHATADDMFVSVIVADNGGGIAPEHLPQLFERFCRVGAGQSRDQGGTGLGLSIVKHLFEAMGGMVEVASTVGKGTTFIFSLPSA